jgi:hypothetical protein
MEKKIDSVGVSKMGFERLLEKELLEEKDHIVSLVQAEKQSHLNRMKGMFKEYDKEGLELEESDSDPEKRNPKTLLSYKLLAVESALQQQELDKGKDINESIILKQTQVEAGERKTFDSAQSDGLNG